MEISTMSSRFAIDKRMVATFPSRSRSSGKSLNFSSGVSVKASLTSNVISPFVRGSVTSDFYGQKIRPVSVNPSSITTGSRGKKSVFTVAVARIAGERTPPDLASYLFKNRIVYLGMPLVPSVTELMIAEFLYLQYEDPEKPAYLYINSTGTTRGGQKLGYETEALAIYDIMSFCKVPIFTLCVGNAWGEAALLLAAGAKGNRSALPSSTIMIKQPIGSFQGQVSDVDLARKEIKSVKEVLVELYAKHMGKSPEQIDKDIRRPKYFSPTDAVEYGIIDKVLYNERGRQDRGVFSDLETFQPT